jgi:hypothetical protein
MEEDPSDPLPITAGSVTIPFRPFEIVTLLIET